MRKEYDFSKSQRGPVLSTEGKTRVPLWLDDDVFAYFCTKAQTMGCGYQGLMNEALKEVMKQNKHS